MEALEQRTMLSFPPLPIDPNKGEQTLLDVAKKFEQKQNYNALDNLPIPFAVVASHAGGTPVVGKNNPQSGSPMRVDVDVDGNLSTGKGGKDVSVEVSTDLFLNGVFNPHLSVTVDRLGSAPYATDFEVLVSFPFAAFNAESLPGSPNLFIGYKTTGAAGPDDPGGIAPLTEQIRFVPNVQAGADHQVEIQLNTTGASNPMQFLTGYFDGTNLTGILDAAAYAAWVQQPPQNIAIGLGVDSSALGVGPIGSNFDLSWTASSTSKVIFDYLEEESGNLSDSDFNTTVTFDQMPTSEVLSIGLDESASAFTLSHRANSTIGKVEIVSERKDGLKIVGTLTDVPTEVDVNVGLAGTATLDVNANTLDMKLEIMKEGGFLDTADFLGYNIGYVSFGLTDAPDLTIGYLPASNSVGVAATNPGECIGSVELLIDDDAHYENGTLVGLELPPEQDELLPPDGDSVGLAPWDDPNRHVFSLIDDGTHGTAAVRLVHVSEASLSLDAADISEAFHLKTCEAAPMTLYLRTTNTSNLIPGHDVEVTANINDIPEGEMTFTIDPPTTIGYTTDPATGIDYIHAFGHVDGTNFDIVAGNLPAVFSYTFDPDGSLSVTADDGDGVPEPADPGDQIGLLGVLLWNDTDPDGLSGSLKELFGVPIRNAVFRVDDIPSFTATWVDDTGHTNISFDTVANDAYLGGVQVVVSTEVVPLSHLPGVAADTADYLHFLDKGGAGEKRLDLGAFGIDSFSYDTNDANATYALSYDSNAARPLVVTFDSAFGGKFFPQFHSDLELDVNDVPQTFNFVADLDPGFRYSASDAVDSITLTGTIDDTNDATDNGTDVDFSFVSLPSLVRFSLQGGEIKVIDGLIDVNGDNAVNGADDGVVGGVTVIDGKLDMNFDGVITGADDDSFLGANVIDGQLDMNLDNVVDGNDDGALAGLELKMNGNVTSVSLSLSSENVIFGTPYQLMEAAINTVPAHTLATWAGDKILVETKDASGSPFALGSIEAMISTDNDAADILTKLEPFTANGPVAPAGPVLDGSDGSRIDYSPFLQEIDRRYYDPESTSVLDPLRDLYAGSEQLDPGEDHLVARISGGVLDIASFKFSGFQKLAIEPNANGGHYEFKAPTAGVHPLFVGVGLNDSFVTLQIENIPDSATLDIDTSAGNIHFHTDDDTGATLGQIDVFAGSNVYEPGVGLIARDNDTAFRAILNDTPDDVLITWDLSFPPSIVFDASNPFQILALFQNGSKRFVGGLQLEDLQIGASFSFPLSGSEEVLGLPTAFDVASFKAGFDNDPSNPAIQANNAKTGIDGFFTLYDLIGSPQELSPDPAGVDAAGSEYVPTLSFMMKDFREASIEVTLQLDPFPDGVISIPIIPGLLSIDVELSLNIVGDFVFDVWTHSNIDATVDIDPVGDFYLGFINPADYTDNTPIHIFPGLSTDAGTLLSNIRFSNPYDWVITFDGFHLFGGHIDPLA